MQYRSTAMTTITPKNNDLFFWIKNNQAAIAARTFEDFFDVISQIPNSKFQGLSDNMNTQK